MREVATRRLAGSLTDTGNNGTDGKRLVTLGSDIADVWDLAARKVIATLSNGATDSPADIAANLAVSPDGTSVAVPYHDGRTVVYSAQTGRPTLTLTDPGLVGDRSDAMAAFSPDGTLIAVTTGVMGQVYIRNIKQAKDRRLSPGPGVAPQAGAVPGAAAAPGTAVAVSRRRG